MHNPFADQKRVREEAGAVQVPMIERENGHWMSDSTPVNAQFVQEQSQPVVMPDDEVFRFISLLIEEYADEWLWRVAMHYR